MMIADCNERKLRLKGHWRLQHGVRYVGQTVGEEHAGYVILRRVQICYYGVSTASISICQSLETTGELD